VRAVWPLVGRDDELKFIVDALMGKSAGGVVLAGPPGVGKTRLAIEAAEQARSNGFATFWVAATATTAEIPFGAMAPLLTDAIVSQADRFRTLARGCSALFEAAGGKPLVLCIDDAHLLDPLSAALVHQAVSTAAAVLLATVRRGHSAPADLTALWKDGRVERLEVVGLSRADSERLVERVLGGRIHGVSLQRLWNVTEGRPRLSRTWSANVLASSTPPCASTARASAASASMAT